MKKIHLVVIVSLIALLVMLSSLWYYGSFNIKKAITEMHVIEDGDIEVTGFPLNYKVMLNNVEIKGIQGDSYLFKKIDSNLRFINKDLHVKLLNEVVVKHAQSGVVLDTNYSCKIPTEIIFKYKDYFWFLQKNPKVQKFNLANKDCNFINNNQQILKIDSTNINIDNTKSNKTSFNIAAKGFKESIFDDIKIGEFNAVINGEFKKSSVVDNKEQNIKSGILAFDGQQIRNIKFEANLDSDLKINSNLSLEQLDKGYQGKGELTLSQLNTVLAHISKIYSLNENIVQELLKVISSQEGGATKFIFQFSPEKGFMIANQEIKELVKKYFYLRQVQKHKPTN